MIHRQRILRAGLACLLAGALLSTCVCAASKKKAKKPVGHDSIKGYKGLYLGHSFFGPVARAFEGVIKLTSVGGHTQEVIQSMGASGSPGKLWDKQKHRRRAQKYLDSGEVDLLVMTYYSPENSGVEDYVRWFDYALKKNPKITFMVTIPWSLNAPKWDKATVAGSDDLMKGIHDTLIPPLRKKYPNNKVLYCPYGLGVFELVRRLQAGNLPGVKYVLAPNKATGKKSNETHQQLVKDKMGHATPLIIDLSTLLWLQTLYEYDLSTLKLKPNKALPDIDLKEIAATVHKKIAPYNAIYEGQVGPSK